MYPLQLPPRVLRQKAYKKFRTCRCRQRRKFPYRICAEVIFAPAGPSITLPSGYSKVKFLSGRFLKELTDYFTGNTASPGSRTLTPDAEQIIEKFLYLLPEALPYPYPLTRTDERILIELELEVLLSASPQLWRNNFLFIKSFIRMTSCSYLYNIKKVIGVVEAVDLLKMP